MRKKKIRQCDTWIMMTLILTVIFVGMISVNVLGKEKNQSRFDERYYQAMEKEYRQSLRQCLEQSGYPDTGITMTKSVDSFISMTDLGEEVQNREYFILIYNKKINRLTEQERNILLTEIVEITFPINGCTVYHDFLKIDL